MDNQMSNTSSGDSSPAKNEITSIGAAGTSGGSSPGVAVSLGDSLFTGAATASIPIAVPPGRSAVTTPNLSLTYNSGNGDGWTSVGWDLNLGAIEKTGDDYFLIMNGISTRLEQRDGAYWPVKHEGPLMKIEWKDHYKTCNKSVNGSDCMPFGRGQWIAYTSDGTKYHFGWSDEATKYVYKWWVCTIIPLTGLLEAEKWHLDRIEDAMGNVAITEFDPQSHTYPVKIISGLKDRLSLDVRSAHVTRKEYDYRFGTPVKSWDMNGNLTQYEYDPFGRLKKATYPDGGETYVSYYETFSQYPRHVITWSKDNAGGGAVSYSWEYFDGLGRRVRSVIERENEKKYVVTREHYDPATGRKTAEDGPFFSDTYGYNGNAGPASGEPLPGCELLYDSRGRLCSTKTYLDAGEAVTAIDYDGLSVTKTDADGKRRTEVQDAYGHLIELKEHADEGDQTTRYE